MKLSLRLPLLLALVAVAACSGPGCGGCGRGYSDGDRTGYVVKMSQKGLWMKSWEGSMHLAGGAGGGGGSGSDTWDFSVIDESLVPVLQKAEKDGARVTLHYTQWYERPNGIDTRYEVTGVAVEGADAGPARSAQ